MLAHRTKRRREGAVEKVLEMNSRKNFQKISEKSYRIDLPNNFPETGVGGEKVFGGGTQNFLEELREVVGTHVLKKFSV